MGSTVLTATSGRDTQGRSASGRNGGARKATSSNSVVMLFVLNDDPCFSVASHSKVIAMTTRSCPSAVCARFSFAPARLGRAQPAGVAVFLRYTSAILATALIHTVHGGAEPRACLTGLRV